MPRRRPFDEPVASPNPRGSNGTRGSSGAASAEWAAAAAGAPPPSAGDCGAVPTRDALCWWMASPAPGAGPGVGEGPAAGGSGVVPAGLLFTGVGFIGF